MIRGHAAVESTDLGLAEPDPGSPDIWMFPGLMGTGLRSPELVSGGCSRTVGAEPAQCRVSPGAVMEALEVVEDRVRELDSGATSATVEQLRLHRPRVPRRRRCHRDRRRW